MKKLISSGIILFVLTYVLTVGFLILKTSFTDGFSNADLIANFLVPPAPALSVNVAHLADATSTVVPPSFQEPLALDSFSALSPIIPSTSTIDSDTTSTPTSITTSTPDTSASDTNSTLASAPMQTSTNEINNPTSTEQNLEVLAATLINLQMTSTSETQ